MMRVSYMLPITRPLSKSPAEGEEPRAESQSEHESLQICSRSPQTSSNFRRRVPNSGESGYAEMAKCGMTEFPFYELGADLKSGNSRLPYNSRGHEITTFFVLIFKEAGVLVTYLPEVLCDVSPGIRDDEVTVSVADMKGNKLFLQVGKGFVNSTDKGNYLPVGIVEVDRENARVLVELPHEADSGANRLWVPFQRVRQEDPS